jgi:hypothetical protein
VPSAAPASFIAIIIGEVLVALAGGQYVERGANDLMSDGTAVPNRYGYGSVIKLRSAIDARLDARLGGLPGCAIGGPAVRRETRPRPGSPD